MKIIFIQTSLPTYREDFFQRINRIFTNDKIAFELLYSDKCDFNDYYQFIKNTQNVSLFKTLKYLKDSDVVIIPSTLHKIHYVLLTFALSVTNTKVIHYGHFRSGRENLKHLFYFRMIYSVISSYLLFYTDNEIYEYERNTLAYFICGKKRAFALQNGIDIKPIIAMRKRYDAMKRKDIVFIGRLTKKSNIDLLIKAFSAFSDRDCKLHIIGGGELEKEVRAYVFGHNLESSILLHGSLNCEVQISKIANKCRLSVYPGNVGLSLGHTLAYGLPTIIHNDRESHMPEADMFRENWVTFLFKKDSRSDLILKMKNAMDDITLLNSISAEAKEVAYKFNTEVMANRFCDMIKNIRQP